MRASSLGWLVTCVAVAAPVLYASAREVHVSTGAGLIALSKDLRPGDVCYLRGGTYRTEMVLEGLRGEAGNPIAIMAYPSEAVVFDGSDPVNPSWKPYKNGIFKTKLKKNGWQLFFNGKTMTTARFPDASWDDGTIWDLMVSC